MKWVTKSIQPTIVGCSTLTCETGELSAGVSAKVHAVAAEDRLKCGSSLARLSDALQARTPPLRLLCHIAPGTMQGQDLIVIDSFWPLAPLNAREISLHRDGKMVINPVPSDRNLLQAPPLKD